MPKLIVPTMEYERELLVFRREFLVDGEGAAACGSLALYEDIRDWIHEVELLGDSERIAAGDMPQKGRTPRKQYVYLREADRKIVGYLQIRHPLNPYLQQYAGHIGYCVCPSERRKGYATRMLRDAVSLCRAMGIDPILLCCEPENEGSKRAILRCGGAYQAAVQEPETGTLLERYRI